VPCAASFIVDRKKISQSTEKVEKKLAISTILQKPCLSQVKLVVARVCGLELSVDYKDMCLGCEQNGRQVDEPA
jgi:hypothetical protein